VSVFLVSTQPGRLGQRAVKQVVVIFSYSCGEQIALF